jgi:hypothetical protein
VVETSVVSSLVNSDQPWTVNLSVGSKRLIEVCSGLKRLGASGQEMEVRVEKRMLWLKFRTTQISIPTLWVKPG